MTIARRQSVDHLGRILPEVTLESILEGVPFWSPRSVVDILMCIDADAVDAHNAVVEAAWSVGITHGPPDLAGRRNRLEKKGTAT